MQWDKVKNILLVVLVAVNAFLLANLGVKQYQDARRASELMAHVGALLAARDVGLDDSFRMPQDKVLPALSIDSSRADEEALATAMLGAQMTRTEEESGAIRFDGRYGGILYWNEDGTVQGSCVLPDSAPAGEDAVRRRARTLFQDWGVWTEGAELTVVGQIATLTAPVAGMPVHNRYLSVYFTESGGVELTGFWSFSTPYAATRETGVTCSAADALLAFAAETPGVGDVHDMQIGYRLQQDSGRRLQLVPTWKIQTQTGEYLVDCAKKTAIS